MDEYDTVILAINGENVANCDKEVEKWLGKLGLK